MQKRGKRKEVTQQANGMGETKTRRGLLHPKPEGERPGGSRVRRRRRTWGDCSPDGRQRTAAARRRGCGLEGGKGTLGRACGPCRRALRSRRNSSTGHAPGSRIQTTQSRRMEEKT